MVEQAADDLNKTLDNRDAVILFEYHWNNGKKDIMCHALADANMTIDGANMNGNNLVANQLVRLSFAVDKFDFKGIKESLVQLRDSGIDFDSEIHHIHSLISKIGMSCNQWTSDIIRLLLDNSKIANKLAGLLLSLQAGSNCGDGVKLLLLKGNITSSDINRALEDAKGNPEIVKLLLSKKM